MNIQVVTFMGRVPRPDEFYYFVPQMLESVRRFGVEPIILGRDPGQFNGLGSKCKLLQRAIISGELSADYLILTDSFDVVFSASPDDILAKFLEIRGTNRIIWGAERACFSDASLAPLHPPTDSSFKYLNSGWGIGETVAFVEALAEMNPEETIQDDHKKPDGTWAYMNDQDAWMRQMLFGKSVPIGLDHKCELVQNYCDVPIGEIMLEPQGKFRNLETGSYPLVQHLNGGSKNIWKDRVLGHAGFASRI